MQKKQIFCYPWQHGFYESGRSETSITAMIELKRIFAMIQDMYDMNENGKKAGKVIPYYILFEDGHYPYGFHLKGWSDVRREHIVYPFTNGQYFNATFSEIGASWWDHYKRSTGHTLDTEKEVYEMTIEEFNEEYHGDIVVLLSTIQSEFLEYNLDEAFWQKKDTLKRIVRMILPMSILTTVFQNLDIKTAHQYDYPEADMFENANKEMIDEFGKTFLLKGSYNENEHTVSSFLKHVAITTDPKFKRKVSDHTVISDIADFIYTEESTWKNFIKNLCTVVNASREDSMSIPVFYNEVSFDSMEFFMKTLFATDVVMFQREWYSIKFFTDIAKRHEGEEIGMALLYGSAHRFEKWQDDTVILVEPQSVKEQFPDRIEGDEHMSVTEYPLDFYTSMLGIYMVCTSLINDKQTLVAFEALYEKLTSEYHEAFDKATKGYVGKEVGNNVEGPMLGDFDLESAFDELMEQQEEEARNVHSFEDRTPEDLAILHAFDDLEMEFD